MRTAVAICLLMTLVLRGDDQPVVAASVGRYQIISGEGFLTAYDFKVIIKLDTVTGQTWRLTIPPETNAPVVWLEIPTMAFPAKIPAKK